MNEEYVEPKETNKLLEKGEYKGFFIEVLDRFENGEKIGYNVVLTDLGKKKNCIWFVKNNDDIKKFAVGLNQSLKRLNNIKL